ncbi:MAG TPA: molybdopterin-binding protein [Gaiellaceae bacterium]|nr:molybdopterin-binding protein [Gaiellaceae bacterium]
MATAAIVTIGNELLSGDVANTNGAWLAKRFEAIGLAVRLMAVLPDQIEEIAAFLRAHGPAVDVVIVTGGLGGTPDDVTREALAATFGMPRVAFPEVAAALRARFSGNPDYVTPWASLPEGSRPLENPLGGAPGFAIGNVYVLPGLPSEMEAMFELVAAELAGAPPIESWRRTYATTESRIVDVLRELEARYPGVRVGSYPSFSPAGSEVEVVLKSSDPTELAAASAWAEAALEAVS